MLQISYVIYALFAQQLFNEDALNNVVILGILLGKLLLSPKKISPSIVAAIVGILTFLEYHLFLEAFKFGNIPSIQALMVFKVLLGILLESTSVSRSYGLSMLCCFIGIVVYMKENWELVVHVVIMGLNYIAIKCSYQIIKEDSNFMVNLIGLFISIAKFKSFQAESPLRYLFYFGMVIMGTVCHSRDLEGSKWACLASILVFSIGSLVFKEPPAILLVILTVCSHLTWFLYLIRHEEYKELPVSVNDTTAETPKKKKWGIFIAFTFGVLLYSFGDFFVVQKNLLPLSQEISEKIETEKERDVIEHIDKFLNLTGPQVSGVCNERYGSALINSFKSSKTSVCSSKDKSGTSIDCYYHGGRKGVSAINYEALCEIKNYKMDLGLISKLHFPQNSKLEFWEMDSIRNSTFGTCDSNVELVKEKINTEEPAAFLLNSFSRNDDLNCTDYYNKTILFVSRWDTTNLYHATEDFIQAWISILVTGIDPKHTIVVRLDTKVMGPFTSFFNYAVPNKKIPQEERISKNATRDLINIVDWANKIKITCFSRAVFGIFAVPSPVSFEIYRYHPAATTCGPPDTAIFTSFKEFMIKAYNFPLDSELPPRSDIHLAYLSRKGFLREIRNEDQLLKKISSTVCGTKERCELQIEVFDYSTLPFYKQISVARNADILLGMHGAALASGIYLRNTSALIEIGHPTRSSNQHFQNLARFMGLKYRVINGNDFLSDRQIEDISNAVKEEVDLLMNL